MMNYLNIPLPLPLLLLHSLHGTKNPKIPTLVSLCVAYVTSHKGTVEKYIRRSSDISTLTHFLKKGNTKVQKCLQNRFTKTLQKHQ